MVIVYKNSDDLFAMMEKEPFEFGVTRCNHCLKRLIYKKGDIKYLKDPITLLVTCCSCGKDTRLNPDCRHIPLPLSPLHVSNRAEENLLQNNMNVDVQEESTNKKLRTNRQYYDLKRRVIE